MSTFWKKYQAWIIGAAAIAIVLYLVYQFVYTEPAGYVPQDYEGNPLIGPTFDANNIATELRLALEGPTSYGAFQAAMNMILDLTDAEFIEVNNAFRMIYGDQEHPTIRSFVGNEWLIWPSSISLRNEVYDRLTRLSL